jgi:hypothetical protein
VRNLDRYSTVLFQVLDKLCAEFIPCEYETITADKSAQLNRIDNDWSRIQEVFPEHKPPGLFSRWTRRSQAQSDTALQKLALTVRAGRSRLSKPRALGVLLCYNDADILPDAIEALLNNNHELVVWDHGSDDGTAEVLDRYAPHCIERRLIPRSFDFYQLYPEMSKNLLRNHGAEYDWISWPDQDEILEGPARDRSYYDYLTEVVNSEFDWVQFRNFNYWLTSQDDPSVSSPVARVRHYCLFPDCAPRIRAWRPSAGNIRQFNHNPPQGRKYPQDFNLRHYPMRDPKQMLGRLNKDRSGLERNGMNYHYSNMKQRPAKLVVAAECLHLDDGKSELNHEVVFDWRSIYGHQNAGAGAPAEAVPPK